MHELFSLQVDINALNHRSSHIVYSWGSAVGEFLIPKTCLIGFPSRLTFTVCFIFPCFYLLIFRVFRFRMRLDQHLCCSLPVASTIWALLSLSPAGIRTPFQMLLSTLSTMLLPALLLDLFTDCSTYTWPCWLSVVLPPLAREGSSIKLWLLVARRTQVIVYINLHYITETKNSECG